MDLKKLIYDIKEAIPAISDDRHIPNRYIEHLIGIARADFIRKLLSERPGYNTLSLEQNVQVSVLPVSRSIVPGLNIPCKVLRSTNPIPKILNEGTMSNYYKVRSADILNSTFKIIEPERASHVVFEYPVVYTFLDFNYYLYFILPGNHQELRYAVLSGVFQDPKEVDPSIEDYPISPFMWKYMREDVLSNLRRVGYRDPLNNSEFDYGQPDNDRRKKDTEEVQQ